MFLVSLLPSAPCLSFGHVSVFSSSMYQGHTVVREARAGPGPQSSPCGLPQEGALDLLKKLHSCQMSIQLLQVGWGREALGQCLGGELVGEGKTPKGGRWSLGGISEGRPRRWES